MNRSGKSQHGAWELLRRPGSAEILVSLKRGDQGFNEFKKKLNVSSKTISARLQDLKKGGLIEIAAVKKGEKIYKKYRLTGRGTELASDLEQVQGTAQEVAKKWGPLKLGRRSVRVLPIIAPIMFVALVSAAATLSYFYPAESSGGIPLHADAALDAVASAQLEATLESRGISGGNIEAYTSEQDVSTIASWQKSEMARLGWTVEMETTTAVSSQILFKRGDRAQNFVVYRLADNTGVLTVEGDWETVSSSYGVVQEAAGIREGDYIDPTTTSAADVWFAPDGTTASVGDEFSIGVHVNTGSLKLGAYHFVITFDDSIVSVDADQGMQGVEAGADGFVTISNASVSGQIIFNGFDVEGKGPGEDLHVATIYWSAQSAGTTALDLTVGNLTSEIGLTLGTPHAIDGTVTVE